ncbi:ROK family protein [Ruania albidiflava]|uniref:ROK family protein n=1 Tax=Ruania albidiflava TaxID=366586 RepID=UPI000412CE07|nr:ROK family protein [Ruania albidiflava]
MIQTVPAAQPAPVLAADLGGTKISAGLVDGAGRVHARRTVPTGAMAGPVAVVATLVEVLTVVREDAAAQALAPAAVGIGTAGVVDSGTGRIVSATDAIPGWAGTELGTSVAAALDLPTRVLNDVHAHALGEDTFGAGAGASSLLLVAVGTGIGGALVQGGAVLTGTRGVAGHVGHVPVPEADGVPCTCGRTGHVEGLASGPGTLAAYRRAGGRAGDTREVVARAEGGEELAATVLRTCALAIGRMVGGLLNVLDPEVVVLTGGMAGSGRSWWQGVHDGVAHEAIDLVAGTEVLPATAGDAALLGAAQFVNTREEP